MTLKIYDCGEEVTLQPSVELYSVKDFMGQELPGLGIVLDMVGETPEDQEEYAVLTVSFGEFISARNCAYIDINECPFAQPLLDQGIAEDTGFTRRSGFCTYPLWRFKESFLKEIGGENYRIYTQKYNAYMGIHSDEQDLVESEESDETQDYEA